MYRQGVAAFLFDSVCPDRFLIERDFNFPANVFICFWELFWSVWWVVCVSRALLSLGCIFLWSFPTRASELGPLFLDILAHFALCAFMLFTTLFRPTCFTFLYSFQTFALGREGLVWDFVCATCLLFVSASLVCLRGWLCCLGL